MKVKGSALIYSLMIMLVVGLIASSFLWMHEIKSKWYHEYATSVRLQDNCYSGLVLLQQEWMSERNNILDLFEKQTDSVALKSFMHGIFQVNHCSSFSFGDSLKKGTLNAPMGPQETLILEDQNYELALSGNTKILGNIQVPNGQVNTATFRGDIIRNREPVIGEVSPSPEEFPLLDERFIEHLNQVYSPLEFEVAYPEYSRMHAFNGSFEKETLRFHLQGALHLKGDTLAGNCVISSDRSIHIHSDCALNHTVLIAPSIYVQDGFEGFVQLFVTDTLVLQPHVNLEFPSACVAKAREDNPVHMEIMKKSKVEGILLVLSENNTGRLVIHHEAKIQGQVYSHIPLQLEGLVEGSIVSHAFVQQDASAIRHNLLYNGEIYGSESTAMVHFFENEKTLHPIAWLD
jgi:hypothetical protein